MRLSEEVRSRVRVGINGFDYLDCSPAEARRFCRAHALVLIGDCAHALPDTHVAPEIGAMGEIAIFSLRKQLPVPDGGVLRVNAPTLHVPPSRGGECQPSLRRVAVMVAERVVFATGRNPLVWKSRLRGIAGTTDPCAVPLAEMDSGPSWLTLRLLRAVAWDARLSAKRHAYRLAVGCLAGMPGLEIPFPEPDAGSVPLGLPVRVDDPATVGAALRARGIGASQWPGAEHLPGVDLVAFPGTCDWMARGLLLPAHEDLSGLHSLHMADAVRAALAVRRRSMSVRNTR